MVDRTYDRCMLGKRRNQSMGRLCAMRMFMVTMVDIGGGGSYAGACACPATTLSMAPLLRALQRVQRVLFSCLCIAFCDRGAHARVKTRNRGVHYRTNNREQLWSPMWQGGRPTRSNVSGDKYPAVSGFRFCSTKPRRNPLV
eukprot:621913-Pyramimonas_sp.AAC.1